jgi:hypothetical protein
LLETQLDRADTQLGGSDSAELVQVRLKAQRKLQLRSAAGDRSADPLLDPGEALGDGLMVDSQLGRSGGERGCGLFGAGN